MRFRRTVPVLLGATVALGVAWGQTPPAAPTLAAPAANEVPAPTVATRPLESTASAAVVELRSDLERLIRNLSTPNSLHGVLVVSLERGDTLFSYNPDLPLAPASNMKLFSTAAALYYLGPNFRYSTYALGTGPIEDGVLNGDLVLYGTGDPAISSRLLGGPLTPLRTLADSLLAKGVREIRGDVVGDGSYFDDAWIAEGWKDEYRLDSYSAPVGALSLAENIVSIRVSPGASPGDPASIRTMPSTDGLLIQNRVTTVANGRSTVRFAYDPEGLVIEGRIARGHPGVARTVTVVDPANYAAAAFRDVLEDAGIRVNGGVRTVRSAEASPIGFAAGAAGGESDAPARVLGMHLSPPLSEIVAVTNHISQNLFAESLFKTVGRIALGDGSFEGGARAVQYFLECEKPVDLSRLSIVDGSGLSPINRVTPRSIIHLLDLMTRTDVWEPFLASLPEAASPNGGNHSLRGRMGGTSAARNLRAKTGTISGVSGLSGYVRSADGELLAFSILTNEIRSTSAAKRAEDAIGARLASFARPESEPPDLLGVPGDPPRRGDDLGVDQAGAPTNASETAVPAGAASNTHRVARGETLDGIARRYGTTVTELQRMNPEVQPRRLQIGQTLTVPVE